MASMPSNDDDNNIPTKTPATPRRASATKRPGQNGTPVRKTPNNAPARKGTGSGKKEPPTLFQDFLLGRPSPQRTGRPVRRKSLDIVKKELKLGVEEVKKVRPPSAVQDRVKQWQKASAGAVIVDPLAPGSEEEKKAKSDIQVKKTGRRKSKEAEDAASDGRWVTVNGITTDGKGITRRRSKSAGAPRKRVISDEHWRKREVPTKGSPIPKNFLEKTAQNPSAKKKIEDWVRRNESDEIVVEVTEPPKKVLRDEIPKARQAEPKPSKQIPKKGSPIPKNFLEKTAQNPTPSKKMEDWFKRNEADVETESQPDETPRSRKSSRFDDIDNTPTRRKVSRQDDTSEIPRRRKSPQPESLDDGIRVRASKSSDGGIRVKTSKLPDDGIHLKPSQEPESDGIRIKPSPDPVDDGIRIKPSRDNSFNQGDDSIRVKPLKLSRKTKPLEPAEIRTPRSRSEKHLRPPDSCRSEDDSESGEENAASWTTPSRTQTKRKSRKSRSPSGSVSEIPFGDSAFSVLDLPVGAEANTLRRPAQPKRNSSFAAAVPKVLKKVYTEAKNIVHEAEDPARSAPNQPRNIESWLNETSDPFVDRPPSPKSTLDIPEDSLRRRSYKDDDRSELNLTANAESYQHKRNASEPKNVPSPRPARDTLPSMENSPPASPVGLRRRAATRTASSPKTERKVPLKEALLDAFRGESTTYRVKDNPLADLLSGPRDNRRSPETQQDEKTIPEDLSAKLTPRANQTSAEKTTEPTKPLSSSPRRLAPTTGQHRLSTIASVATLSTLSSAIDTESDLSHTTVTQTQSSIYTAPTSSSLSRESRKSGSGSGLKRRLTKHSDLISVLSLPDSSVPGRPRSIRSARSIRTSRTPLETATIPDLLRELATDETKYMRELKTLVDGVIPVLLTCVLSKSDSAIAAGLFSPTPVVGGADSAFTKPIVDMGIALERLKSLHNRIPLEDSITLVTWFQNAYKTYDDYLTAWRMGFQDVVVNLAPTSPSTSAQQTPNKDEMPLNANGDVVKEDGERVDVAFLLKRPLVRVKHLCKVVKGLHNIKPTDASLITKQKWEELEIRGRRRTKEEAARMVDRAANATDTTRARDLETLALAEDVKIDQTRQVCAKDSFALDMLHSSGQRVEMEIELLFRDKPWDKSDPGDVLVCATDELKNWLLFPPIPSKQVSARIGDSKVELVVMVRGEGDKWQEVFLLMTDDEETAAEWIDMLGTSPIPPPMIRDDISLISTSMPPARQPSQKDKEDIAIPIGERRRREEEEIIANSRKEEPIPHRPAFSPVPSTIIEESIISEQPKDLNEAMSKAGKTLIATKHARSRYHSRGENTLPSTPADRSSGNERRQKPIYTDGVYERIASTPKSRKETKKDNETYMMSGGLPYVEKEEVKPASTPEASIPLKESMRPGSDIVGEQQSLSSSARDDGAPPPPAHRVATTPNLKKFAPGIESPTPKGKNRRTSSPLKHEYQPSDASGTSSSSDLSDSDLSDSYTGSSDDEDLDEPAVLPQIRPTPVKRSPSIYSLPNTSLAPSNSASQAPYRGIPVRRNADGSKKLVATISNWVGNKWADLHDGPCSIVVSDGLIEVFKMDASHSSPKREPISESLGLDSKEDVDAQRETPLIAQHLTPLVPLRQSTAVDVEIQSIPTADSLLKNKIVGRTIRYRTHTPAACHELYANLHRARCNNEVWLKLEREREVNSYGTHSYEAAVASSRRRSWFGRSNSYRASARAPTSDDQSSQSHSSSMLARLRRRSGSGMFNIDKSNIIQGNGANTSQYTGSSRTSMFSGPTPPRTPNSPSLSSSMTSGKIPTHLGSENLKIRLYFLTPGGWDDRGSARLDISVPPPGMHQRSSLRTGIERRVTARLKGKEGEPGIVVLDEVLGSDCFQKVQRTGIAVNVWEDLVDEKGEVGRIRRTGGVSGTTKKWMFQTSSAAECNWIYSLCAVGH
ncbi:hypothetical protein B0O99DRAFT_606209 [Bisporella sp. PMI_857]|nr:hypothetical protein B0O99DRAFT_606209 [Bisporella sp. PMI_857]